MKRQTIRSKIFHSILIGVFLFSLGAVALLPQPVNAIHVEKALDFDGTDDYVNCGTDIFMASTFASGFTVEAWLKADTLDDDHQAAISIKGRLELGVYATTDKAYLFVYDDPGSYWVLGDSAISTGRWYHIAGTWDGTTNKISVNGAQQADTQTSNVPAIDVSRAITIGAHYNGAVRNLDGLIGEVRVYNRGLTPLEIHRNYLATKWRYQ